MGASRIAIHIDETLLTRLDQLVQIRAFPNRSKIIQEAIREKLERFDRGRLVRECKKLDRQSEQALAEEGLDDEEWLERFTLDYSRSDARRLHPRVGL